MHTLTEERLIAVPVENVWEHLADLRNFERNDPFHHEYRPLSERQSGVGAEFLLRHTYFPIFPLRSDFVRCRVTRWQPLRRVSIHEMNGSPFKSHTQDFELSPIGRGVTHVRYTITYRGIPSALFPLKVWATWLVKKRMADKLRQIEQEYDRIR